HLFFNHRGEKREGTENTEIFLLKMISEQSERQNSKLTIQNLKFLFYLRVLCASVAHLFFNHRGEKREGTENTEIFLLKMISEQSEHQKFKTHNSKFKIFLLPPCSLCLCGRNRCW
ncbi:MAG: hypothetical protein ABFS23_10000, partial [Pseudomonadota bacterium]